MRSSSIRIRYLAFELIPLQLGSQPAKLTAGALRSSQTD